MSEDAKARAKARIAAERAMEAKAAQDKANEPTLGEKILSGAVGGGPTLPGMVSGAVGAYTDEANKALDKGAYKLGGAVTDMASNAGASPEVAAGAGYAANVGVQTLPMVAGGAITKPLVGPAKDASRALMQSAVKPTLKALKSGDASRAIDTMLKRGFNATEGGMARIKLQIEKLNNEIASAIQNSTATVSKAEVGKSLLSTLDKFQKQVNANADVKTIKQAWMEFRNHPLLAGKTEIPVQLAQELKQGTYKQLSKKYGEMSGAEVESQKALARGLKEQIAQKVPGINNLNKEESELINTLNVAERRVLMGMNNNPAGLSLLAGNKAAAAAFMADKSALFKSLMARMLYSNADEVIPSVGRIGVGAVEAGTQN